MNILLSPAIRLTERFRISQKVAIVAIAFAVPLLVMVALLFNQMRTEVAAAVEKQQAVLDIQSLQQSQSLFAQHRALTHMQLSGNKQLESELAQLRQQITDNLKQHPLDSRLQSEWQAVLSASANSKPAKNFADHSKLIDDLQDRITQLSNDSKLSVDTDFMTNKLVTLSFANLPSLASQLSVMAARGAAYIDTGLLEAGEDVMLNSLQMSMQQAIKQNSDQLSGLARMSPAFQPAGMLAALTAAGGFLSRSQDEVLASVNQSSGKAFNGAGKQVIAELNQQNQALGKQILQRLDQQIHVLNMQMLRMFVMIAVLIVVAVYFLLAIYTSFIRDIGALTEAIEKAANGDLSISQHHHGRDELGALLESLNQMKQGLAQLIGEIRQGAGRIDNIAEEIHLENLDLSARTENQASALQETASAVEQLTASTQENSANLAQASQLVGSAAQRVQHGLGVMHQAIDSMQSVTVSSRKIGEIIGVMDGIAFQTNILALNAAVEAARAGQEGRGFAVVASEVRNLAQRSANAAKEIKTLIDSSGNAVRKGSEMINTAGTTMQEIAENVARVSELIQHVASVGRQQSHGISSVNQAIASIDEVTQHNASLVEQAKQSTDHLALQAQALNHSVSAFITSLPEHLPPAAGTDPTMAGSGNSGKAKAGRPRKPAALSRPVTA